VPEGVKPEALLHALGVVAEAEPDTHLARRLKRLAHKIASHRERCQRCKSRDGNSTYGHQVWMCDDMVQLVTALTRAAAQGQARLAPVDDGA